MQPTVSDNKLRFYLEEITSIPDDCWEEFLFITNVKEYKRNDIIIHESDGSDNEQFVVDGVVRSYLVDAKGKDCTTAFFPAPTFMSINSMRSNGGRSLYTYEAVTDSTIVSFNSNAFYELFKKYPCFHTVAQRVKEFETQRQNNRETSLMQGSAEEKYGTFLSFYPDLENHIAHYHIASYLGVTPVTLSRIKNK